MANDPVTVSAVTEYNIAPGLKMIAGLITGPSDYDAGTGAVMDLSDYVGTILGGVSLNGVTAIADAAIKADYLSADLTDSSAGLVCFYWSADGTDGEVFIEVTDTTDLDAYQWHFTCFGTEVTRT